MPGAGELNVTFLFIYSMEYTDCLFFFKKKRKEERGTTLHEQTYVPSTAHTERIKDVLLKICPQRLLSDAFNDIPKHVC